MFCDFSNYFHANQKLHYITFVIDIIVIVHLQSLENNDLVIESVESRCLSQIAMDYVKIVHSYAELIIHEKREERCP